MRNSKVYDKAIADFAYKVKEELMQNLPTNYATTRSYFTLKNAVFIIDSVAKKLKKEKPQCIRPVIQLNKVECCENCGDKDFLETSELGISHHRIRLCKECFKDLRDAINLVLKDDN